MNAPVGLRPYHELYDEVEDLRTILEVERAKVASLERKVRASEDARRREARAHETSAENLIGRVYVDREGREWVPERVDVRGRGLATVTLRGAGGEAWEAGISAFRGRRPVLVPKRG